MLRAAAGDAIAAIELHIHALGTRLAIGVPEAVIDIIGLKELRERVGTTTFAEAAGQALDADSYTNLITLLDSYKR
ncbi:hypothetical protein [Dactylosporangium sp. NPDC051541]|uniref:hypothetical protein n=1 Tax=Dactylosporangium sp. NPDC051541 TaxID=3363977 RepID=UPI00379F5BC2